jgi:hypothetical protein
MTPEPLPTTRFARHMAVGGVIVVAAFVGAIAGFLILSGPRGEVGSGVSPSPSIETPSPVPSATVNSTPSPTPTPEPTPTPLPEGAAPMDWVASGAAPDGDVRDVVWMGDRWLAVGSRDGAAATWTSDDGLEWKPGTAVPPEPSPGPDGTGYWMSVVAVHDDGVVAFGWNRIGCCDGGRPMAWQSSDGVGWSVVETQGTAFDQYNFPTSAAVSPRGEVVLAVATGMGYGTDVLVTSDLLDWERITVTQKEFESMSAIASSPSGLLGVGLDGAGDAEQRVWRSSDGRSWTAVAAPSRAGSLSTVAYDAAHDQYVVGGTDAEGRPTMWTTHDGSAWARVTLDQGMGRVDRVSAAEGLIVGVGPVGEPGDTNLIAWSSYDGVTWQIVNLGSHNGYSTAAVGGGTAVAYFMGTGPEPDYVPFLGTWHGTPVSD